MRLRAVQVRLRGGGMNTDPKQLKALLAATEILRAECQTYLRERFGNKHIYLEVGIHDHAGDDQAMLGACAAALGWTVQTNGSEPTDYLQVESVDEGALGRTTMFVRRGAKPVEQEDFFDVEPAGTRGQAIVAGGLTGKTTTNAGGD